MNSVNAPQQQAIPARAAWRDKLYQIIFEADTPAGKAFDVLLIACILLSVAVVMLDSIQSVQRDYRTVLVSLEWVLTFFFTIEYIARLLCAPKPWRYARSFFGVIDLLATLPAYLTIFFPGAAYLVTIRALRLLRVFRIFKLGVYLSEGRVIAHALHESKHKIAVFLMAIGVLITVLGSAIYVIEGPEHGFTSIPKSIYWAIVTLTTVGYGDIAPQTPLGQFLASVAMIAGYGIIAVPTGIVTSELSRAQNVKPLTRTVVCQNCMQEGHEVDAHFCRHCGGALPQ